MFFEFLLQNWTLVLALVVVTALIFFDNKLPGGSGKAVQATDVPQILNYQQGVVLDVRDKETFDKGHIANAKNMPLADIESKIAQIKKWQKKPIIVTCNTGLTAKKAIKTLKANGFENVFLLTGGMQAWLKEGFPTVKTGDEKKLSKASAAKASNKATKKSAKKKSKKPKSETENKDEDKNQDNDDVTDESADSSAETAGDEAPEVKKQRTRQDSDRDDNEGNDTDADDIIDADEAEYADADKPSDHQKPA